MDFDREPDCSVSLIDEKCFSDPERRIPLINFTNDLSVPLIAMECLSEPERRIPLIDLTNCMPGPSESRSSRHRITEFDEPSKKESSTVKELPPTPESAIMTPKTFQKMVIFSNDNEELRLIRRKLLIERCEVITQNVITQLQAGQVPSISYQTPTMDTLMNELESLDTDCQDPESNNKNQERVIDVRASVFETPSSMGSMEVSDSQPEIEESLEGAVGPRTVVSFGRKRSQAKFKLMIAVLATVHQLLVNNKTQTRRSLYYELKSDEATSDFVRNSNHVDCIVGCVANLLECSPWETGLIGTAKGLAAGDMTMTLSENVKIDFSAPGGALIPSQVSNLVALSTNADLVIVVEKDTIFQDLLQKNLPSTMNCILITGKGYPDVPTRMLVRILAETVGLPVHILVDADPNGIDIMLNYKYGSINLCRDQRALACRTASWIGIRPSDLAVWSIPTIPLTDANVKKIHEIQSRPYISEELRRELEILGEGKAEIEAVAGLASAYIPMKLEQAI